jgi:hypothetical protein
VTPRWEGPGLRGGGSRQSYPARSERLKRLEERVHLKEGLKFCQGFRARSGGGRACLARAQCSSTNHPRPRGTFQVLSIRRDRVERTESARWRQQTVLFRVREWKGGKDRVCAMAAADSPIPLNRSTRSTFRFRFVPFVSSVPLVCFSCIFCRRRCRRHSF